LILFFCILLAVCTFPFSFSRLFFGDQRERRGTRVKKGGKIPPACIHYFFCLLYIVILIVMLSIYPGWGSFLWS
jgi:hypothetical protein